MKTKAQILADFLDIDEADVFLSSKSDKGATADYEANGSLFKVNQNGQIMEYRN